MDASSPAAPWINDPPRCQMASIDLAYSGVYPPHLLTARMTGGSSGAALPVQLCPRGSGRRYKRCQGFRA